MMQLDFHCPDCGRAVSNDTLCSACEQDRDMQLAQVGGPSAAVGAIRGEV